MPTRRTIDIPRWRRFRALMIAGIAITGCGAAMANDKVDCEAEFARIMEDQAAFPNVESRIRRMEQLRSQCARTGIYESRLGTFYAMARRYDDARAILRSGLTIDSKYERELRLALFDVDFRQGLLEGAEKEALAIVKEFPDWMGGYGAIGQVRLVQRRLDEAIQNLERSNEIEPTSSAYTLLTMAYYEADRPRESAIAMQKALRLDRSALKHTQAVCAAAFSLVKLGYLDEAQDLLVKHLSVQPAAAQNDTYRAASELVKQRQQESN